MFFQVVRAVVISQNVYERNCVGFSNTEFISAGILEMGYMGVEGKGFNHIEYTVWHNMHAQILIKTAPFCGSDYDRFAE